MALPSVIAGFDQSLVFSQQLSLLLATRAFYMASLLRLSDARIHPVIPVWISMTTPKTDA